MSRIGRAPIAIPANVTVTIDSDVVTVKGPLGTDKVKFDASVIGVEQKDGHIHVTRTNDEDWVRAKHGLYRALIHDTVVGVTEGYAKNLIVNGVGWKVAQQGKDVVLSVGFSHTVVYKAIDGITLTVVAPNEISVKGINKDTVGQIASDIRSIRKPEPYHGYGIAYKDEVIERKEGKTAGK